jgi:hypothetical protein
MRYRVVQPWGRDIGIQHTVVSEHLTIEEAYAAIDRLSAQMMQTGAPPEALQLIVLDEHGNPMPRPGAH